jgi:antitoxin component YwqK of YwqJK toxin-antitoxin module
MKLNLIYIAIISITFSASSLYAQQSEESKYDNGQLEYNIQYDENRDEHGEWKYYFENGQLEMIETYNHGWPSGLWASYYENGQLESQGKFNSEGYENGLWEAYFENGKLNYKGEYNNGMPVKEWIISFDNGSLEASLTFTDKGKPIGEIHANYNNEKPKVSGSFDANGLKTGTWKTYYSAGSLKAEIIYVNDIITEVKSAFDEEGTALVYTKVAEGPLQGQWFDQENDGIDEVDCHAVMYVINFAK